jgi:hypothetical protein
LTFRDIGAFVLMRNLASDEEFAIARYDHFGFHSRSDGGTFSVSKSESLEDQVHSLVGLIPFVDIDPTEKTRTEAH